MLHAISPIDGRYALKTEELKSYYSEYGLIRERIFVELEYLIALSQEGLSQLPEFHPDIQEKIRSIYTDFGDKDAIQVKEIEKITNHDVKAVEYFIKDKLAGFGMGDALEWVHFGLTSQDINNTALPRLIKGSVLEVIIPELEKVIKFLHSLAKLWKGIPMLALTHGQPASPTTVGKEMMVFVERLENQIDGLKASKFVGKFGGATGNFNAHVVTFPEHDWIDFGKRFVEGHLGLQRLAFTTQIDHYDHLAELFHQLMRINTIWIDFCRDIWTYISMDFLRQKAVEGEIGSSAMPHKVNPIDFENAEGNLGLANAILQHLANKLPVSRLQRDLTDSTVLRNVGVPFAHTLIAIKSITKGLGKIQLNETKLQDALDQNWAVVAEAIQNILRREGVEKPYEKLKELTRGNAMVTREVIHSFIDKLEVSPFVRDEMKKISPENYVGTEPQW